MLADRIRVAVHDKTQQCLLIRQSASWPWTTLQLLVHQQSCEQHRRPSPSTPRSCHLTSIININRRMPPISGKWDKIILKRFMGQYCGSYSYASLRLSVCQSVCLCGIATQAVITNCSLTDSLWGVKSLTLARNGWLLDPNEVQKTGADSHLSDGCILYIYDLTLG